MMIGEDDEVRTLRRADSLDDLTFNEVGQGERL